MQGQLARSRSLIIYQTLFQNKQANKQTSDIHRGLRLDRYALRGGRPGLQTAAGVDRIGGPGACPGACPAMAGSIEPSYLVKLVHDLICRSGGVQRLGPWCGAHLVQRALYLYYLPYSTVQYPTFSTLRCSGWWGSHGGAAGQEAAAWRQTRSSPASTNPSLTYQASTPSRFTFHLK